MKKILIGYDGSEPADAAVGELVNAGLPATLEATVLSVAEVWLPPGLAHHAGELAPVATRSHALAIEAVEQSQALAERAAARLRVLFPQWQVRAQSCADSPAWAVVKLANEWGADLVVVGAHSHSVLERFFLGSVAAKVAAEARCSVHIARPRQRPKHPGLRLLVAVDGSHDSREAVQAVARRSWPAGSEFQIVTVLDPRLRTAVAWPEVHAASWVQGHFKDADEWTGRMTGRLAGVLRDSGWPVETHVFDGDPKKVLLRQAGDWDADCIFLGARGLQHGDRLYLGTLASVVAARAPCSVEIVRLGPGAG
jgi:universal stress protein E